MKHANVAIFVPLNGCPHQCSFCNQKSITGQQTQPTPQDVLSAIQVAMSSLHAQTKGAEIAFFGGSFTAIEHNYMCALLNAAAPFVKDKTFAGIRISTRPDAIDDEILTLLKQYGVTSIELGAQSMNDSVLALNQRGHTAEQVRVASKLIKSYDFSLGLQMMTGLYGDTANGAKDTAKQLAVLQPSTVRIYPTITMTGTDLAQKYSSGNYQPMPLDEAVVLCSELLDFFEQQQITVIRLGLHSTPELQRDMLAGPWHPAFRELCESYRIFNRILAACQKQKIPQGEMTVHVSPACISKAIGQGKSNLTKLHKLGYQAKVKPDVTLNDLEFYID